MVSGPVLGHGRYAAMTRIVRRFPRTVIQDYHPSLLGSRPILETRWAKSSVPRIPVPLYCRSREMFSSVQLLEMQDLDVRKSCLERSYHLSSDGAWGQQILSLVMQKMSMWLSLIL